MVAIEDVVALAKRRGFVYPSSELYGGLGGFYDYGPLGTELVRNIKNSWWNYTVDSREDVVGLDSCIILHPDVWSASGHVASFTDPLTECKLCHARFRADQPDEIQAHENSHGKHGNSKIQWTEPRQFNLLFKSFVGPVEDSSNQVYLRGETCQGIFINFPNIVSSTRVKIPFGIAQIGKAFRNEVTPGKYLFRVREFEQMELEYFVHPSDAEKQLEYWKRQRYQWHLSLGLSEANLRFRQHEPDERAHYALDSWDIEYRFGEWGFKELEGIANRADYDLKTHGSFLGRDLSYKNPVTQESFIPYVIEPSVGISRIFLALLIDSFRKIDNRVVLSLKPAIAPYKVAVFPLLANKEELVSKARQVYSALKPDFRTVWDDRGNIGKRYLSQDEIGTPWCVTIDFETLKDDAVTVRNRDTTDQERIPTGKLAAYFRDKLNQS